MMPAIGPSSAEYAMSHPMMPTPTSFHGSMTAPAIAVISPPILNEIFRGARFAMSFAGDTTFAAMFTETLATAMPNTASRATTMRVPGDDSSGSASDPTGFGEVMYERI